MQSISLLDQPAMEISHMWDHDRAVTSFNTDQARNCCWSLACSCSNVAVFLVATQQKPTLVLLFLHEFNAGRYIQVFRSQDRPPARKKFSSWSQYSRWQNLWRAVGRLILVPNHEFKGRRNMMDSNCRGKAYSPIQESTITICMWAKFIEWYHRQGLSSHLLNPIELIPRNKNHQPTPKHVIMTMRSQLRRNDRDRKPNDTVIQQQQHPCVPSLTLSRPKKRSVLKEQVATPGTEN